MKITCSFREGCDKPRYSAAAYCLEHNNEMKRRRAARRNLPKVYVFKRHEYELDEWQEIDRRTYKQENRAFNYADKLSDKYVCLIDIFVEESSPSSQQ